MTAEERTAVDKNGAKDAEEFIEAYSVPPWARDVVRLAWDSLSKQAGLYVAGFKAGMVDPTRYMFSSGHADPLSRLSPDRRYFGVVEAGRCDWCREPRGSHQIRYCSKACLKRAATQRRNCRKGLHCYDSNNRYWTADVRPIRLYCRCGASKLASDFATERS